MASLWCFKSSGSDGKGGTRTWSLNINPSELGLGNCTSVNPSEGYALLDVIHVVG
jgi:hypothetical protein